MGYTTEFDGAFKVEPCLKPEHRDYLYLFSQTRRMKRGAAKAELLPDPTRLKVGLPIGIDGGYFVGGNGFMGQGSDPSVIDFNAEPSGQPDLWCHWSATINLCSIEWDESEKFYGYKEWIVYLIDHFLKPWGYSVSGDVKWFGESRNDIGLISVRDNVVTIKPGSVVYEGE